MKKLLTNCAVVWVMVLVTSATYAVPATLPSDNFDDNTTNTTLWSPYQTNPGDAWLDETSQRLEFRTTAGADDDAMAFYLPNWWGFAATENFSFRVDFHYGSTVSGSVFLGLAKDEDNGVLLDAVYYGDNASFYWDGDSDGIEIGEGLKARDQDDGTLYISYNATTDDLYLSDIGYWAVNAWVTLEDLVQGQWGGGFVGPLLGGDNWGSDAELPSGAAYLDNFVVDSGVIIPEPATIGLLGIGSLAIRRRKK